MNGDTKVQWWVVNTCQGEVTKTGFVTIDKQMGSQPPGHCDAAISGRVAWPSNNCPQVSQQEADDWLMAENLQAALTEDEPMSFRELN